MRIRVGGVELTGRRLLGAVMVIAVAIGLALVYRGTDIGALHQEAGRVNGVAVFVAITLAPMFGFPVSVMHAVAGVRFGLGLAVPLVALSILLQLLGSFALVRMAPAFFAKHLEPLRERLPQAAHTPLTQFTLLLPGAPFFAQNYVLPLVGVPLRTYLGWALPLHLARSLVGILFGQMSAELTAERVIGFVCYFVVLILACSWAFRRLRLRLQGQQPVAGGRTRRA